MTIISQHSNNKTWNIDLAAAANVMAWIGRTPDVFKADLTAMAEYFPHWLLVGGKHGKPVICPSCRSMIVPVRGAMRCLECDQAQPATSLIWLGQIPSLARDEASFSPKRIGLHHAGFAEVTTNGHTFVLVPLTVEYTSEFPNEQPIARYNPRWLDALGLPRASAAHHLAGTGQACIFGWNQWYAMTIAELLQQRMVNHIASLLKIAAGQSPEQAFIGRIH